MKERRPASPDDEEIVSQRDKISGQTTVNQARLCAPHLRQAEVHHRIGHEANVHNLSALRREDKRREKQNTLSQLRLGDRQQVVVIERTRVLLLSQ